MVILCPDRKTNFLKRKTQRFTEEEKEWMEVDLFDNREDWYMISMLSQMKEIIEV